MRVEELLEHGFEALSLPDGGREIDGVYIGDLLSWVMGRAQMDNAWITIMTNVNVIAVASLADTSCVILAEGVEMPERIVFERGGAKYLEIRVKKVARGKPFSPGTWRLTVPRSYKAVGE